MKKHKRATPKPSSVKTEEPETFSYCIGRPWPIGPSNLHGTHICVYAHHTEVHHGTMKEAEGFRDYVDAQTGQKNTIYKLVPIPSKKKKK